METKNRKEAFAEFVKGLNYSDVIRFFNVVALDKMDGGTQMFDYHDLEHAEYLIQRFGINTFLRKVISNYKEECVMFKSSCTYFFQDHPNRNQPDTWVFGIDPWKEILDEHMGTILDYLEEIYSEYGERGVVFVKFPKLLSLFN